jgi:hypothetical protein
MAPPYYPPVCFYFEVKITGIQAESDASFAEADGLESELGIMEIKEGGENRYSHRLPDRATHGKLTLGQFGAGAMVQDHAGIGFQPENHDPKY